MKFVLIISFFTLISSKTENFWFQNRTAALKFAKINNDQLIKLCVEQRGMDQSSCINGYFHTKICRFQESRTNSEIQLHVRTSFDEDYSTYVLLKETGKKYCKVVVDLNSRYNKYCGEIAIHKFKRSKRCPKKYFIMQISSGRYRRRITTTPRPPHSETFPVLLERDDIKIWKFFSFWKTIANLFFNYLKTFFFQFCQLRL